MPGKRERLVDVKVRAVEEDRLGHGMPPVFLGFCHEEAFGAAGTLFPPLFLLTGLSILLLEVRMIINLCQGEWRPPHEDWHGDCARRYGLPGRQHPLRLLLQSASRRLLMLS